MMERGPYPQNWIRFGLQKKKEFLQDTSRLFDGLIVPANILFYQYKATPTLVWMCKDRLFCVDPMSYLLGRPIEALVGRLGELKPSLRKLIERGHGLSADGFSPTAFLRTLQDASDNSIEDFVLRVLAVQRTFTWESFKEYAASYVPLGAESEALFRPDFLIAPYFYSDASACADLNERIRRAAPERYDGVPVYPAIHIPKSALSDGVGLGALGDKFLGVAVWVDDFDERTASRDQIVSLGRLVQSLEERGNGKGKRIVASMYGGYFTMTLYHFGLTAVSHGTLFSESRRHMTSAAKGGPAPVRYYIRQLHQFYPLDVAIRLCEKRDDLLCNCGACRRIVAGDPRRIALYAENEALAEAHFLFNRFQEKKFIGDRLIEDILRDFELNANIYSEISEITKMYRGRYGLEERSVAGVDHLEKWRQALTELSGV